MNRKHKIRTSKGPANVDVEQVVVVPCSRVEMSRNVLYRSRFIYTIYICILSLVTVRGSLSIKSKPTKHPQPPFARAYTEKQQKELVSTIRRSVGCSVLDQTPKYGTRQGGTETRKVHDNELRYKQATIKPACMYLTLTEKLVKVRHLVARGLSLWCWDLNFLELSICDLCNGRVVIVRVTGLTGLTGEKVPQKVFFTLFL